MPDIRIVCVREDMALAEALVEACEAVGFSIDDANDEAEFDDIGAGVVVLSHAALASPVFRVAAQQMIGAHKAVVVNMTRSDVRRVSGDSAVVDFSNWDGEHDSEEMQALSEAVSRQVARRDEGEHVEAPAPAPPPPPQRHEPPTRNVVIEDDEPEETAHQHDADEDDEPPRRRGGVMGGAIAGLGAALLIASALGAFAYYKLGIGAPAQPEAATAAIEAPAQLRRIAAQEIGATPTVQITASIERIAPRALTPTPTAAPTRTASTPAATPARTTTTRRATARSSTPPPRTNWDTTNPAGPTRRGPPT